MDARAEMDSRSLSRSLVLFLGSCAALAIATGWLAWRYLPYERLERFSPEERFAAWEGVLWMLALFLGFLGLASLLQVVGWHLRDALAEFARRLKDPHSDDLVRTVSALMPWWMTTYGLLLIGIAILVRSVSAP